MATTVTYKDETIATVNNETKTLKTSGKWLEDDLTLTDVSGSVPILQDKTVTPTQSEQTIRADAGYNGLSSVKVNPIPSNYGLVTWNGSVLTIS